MRISYIAGKANIKFTQSIETNKALLLPLYINFDLMKDFVKAVDKEGLAFNHLTQNVSQIE